jgi:methylated-DNA-protein-cysteine methyltransferase related protein
MINRESRYQAIYAVVHLIPAGFVATYGQVARLAGLQCGARQVGYALSALTGTSSVPWHRVVNAQGKVSPRSDGRPADEIQRLLLEGEGVHFDEQGRIPLECFQWRPQADNSHHKELA